MCSYFNNVLLNKCIVIVIYIDGILYGLFQVFENKLAGKEHRFFIRHLYANFKKKFGGGSLLRHLMMGSAKTTYYEAWEEKMTRI
jgi:hypothetical protein